MDFDADDSDKLPELPPMGHPLQKLGARLAELLDDDHWAECERLLLEGWAHDEIDRKTGAHWREDSSLAVWFPLTADELERLRVENAALRFGERHNASSTSKMTCNTPTTQAASASAARQSQAMVRFNQPFKPVRRD